MKHYGNTVSLPLCCGQKELLPARLVWSRMEEMTGCRKLSRKFTWHFCRGAVISALIGLFRKQQLSKSIQHV